MKMNFCISIIYVYILFSLALLKAHTWRPQVLLWKSETLLILVNNSRFTTTISHSFSAKVYLTARMWMKTNWPKYDDDNNTNTIRSGNSEITRKIGLVCLTCKIEDSKLSLSSSIYWQRANGNENNEIQYWISLESESQCSLLFLPKLALHSNLHNFRVSFHLQKDYKH